MILTTLSFCESDCPQALRLAQWITRRGGCKEFDLVLVADASTPFDLALELKQETEKAFRSVSIVITEGVVKGWPQGGNNNWMAAAKAAHERGQAWLWIEPDTVPLRAGWLKEIADAYAQCGKKYMGHIYQCDDPSLPKQLMSGIAVYPPEAINEIAVPPDCPMAWDIWAANIMVENGAHTGLIRHRWGTYSLAPTFVVHRDLNTPINAFTLEEMHPEAVLFHRCKDNSLLQLLWKKHFPNEVPKTKPITVVFPVHSGDVDLALHHARWLKQMNRKWAHKAIIAHDPSCHVRKVLALSHAIRPLFEDVTTITYTRPPVPTYPACANHAWQSVARHMAYGDVPWYWHEADGVILKPDWIDKLQEEYDRGGKAWMGPHVKQLGHANGSMVYPANAALKMHTAMRLVNEGAFDYSGAVEYIHDCHDAGHLLYHVWTLVNGQFCPVGGGEIPINISLQLAQTIPPSSVAIHRVKDQSLVDLLLEGRYVP